MSKPESKQLQSTSAVEDLTSKTISDFGEQWVNYQENPGYYGSVSLLDDLFQPLLSLDEVRDKRVADIGSGTGRIVNMLLDAGAAKVVAVEPSAAFPVLQENTAPRKLRSPSRVSHTPWGIDGRPPSMPHVIDLARSHMYDITVASASRRIAPFSTPQPPRNRPGPAESVRISWPVVSTGQSRSWASSG